MPDKTPPTPQNDAEAKAIEIIKTVDAIRAGTKEDKRTWRASLKDYAIFRALSWLLGSRP